MGPSIDVELPRGKEPVFPDRCVRCGAGHPGRTHRILAGIIGWWTWIIWSYGGWVTTRVPACRGCGWKMWFRRWALFALMMAASIALVWWLRPYVLPMLPALVRRLAMLGILFAALMPFLIWQHRHPPAFDVTATFKGVEYGFRDVNYAVEFAMLNDAYDSLTDKNRFGRLIVALDAYYVSSGMVGDSDDEETDDEGPDEDADESDSDKDQQ